MAATYEPEYAVRKLKEAVDYAEITGDFITIRKWVNEVVAAYECQHENIHTTGSVRMIAGDVVDDIVEVCNDCDHVFTVAQNDTEFPI